MSEVTSRHRLSVGKKIWHYTDNIRWMDPLPAGHRRAIFLTLMVMLLAFLWPAPTNQTLTGSENPHDDKHSKPVSLEFNQQNTPASSAQPQHDSQGEWQSYYLKTGQTLTQLFRDHNLPVNDIFAMSQIQGDDQPLNNLHAGQQVKIRVNTEQLVTGLTINDENGSVLFIRQADGTFMRAQ